MVSLKKKEQKFIIRNIFIILFMIAVATGIGILFRTIGFPEANIVVVYLLSILMTARFTVGYTYGIVASVLATGAFNYFFTNPHYTFSVNDPTYLITFSIMTITAFITSTLTSKVKKNAMEAQEREAEASALFQLTNRLTDASDISDIASITTNTISNIMHCRAACLCFDESGHPEQSYIQQHSDGKQVRRRVEDATEIKHRLEGLRTAYDIGDEFFDWPIYGRDIILGILRIPKETAIAMNESQMRLLRSMIESTALAMDRFRSAQDKQKSREETVQERYRSNLLRAISHDLRTPLSVIMGTSEMIMDMSSQDDPRYPLAQDIQKDAQWIHTLVENILTLTRLQDGKLTIPKQSEAVEEVIGGAITHIMKRSPQYEITVNIPDEVLLVPMDAKLIEQVIINLLENAVKHSQPENEINICVREDKEKNISVFCVSDCGSGIAVSDLPHIFQMFYSAHNKQADAIRGVGLGLTICEAIIKAHGGTIEAHNRYDGKGAEFVFTLPMEVKDYAE